MRFSQPDYLCGNAAFSESTSSCCSGPMSGLREVHQELRLLHHMCVGVVIDESGCGQYGVGRDGLPGAEYSRQLEWVANPEVWIALLTLTALEVVLGIDNIVFISILAGKLPLEQQPRARRVGLSLARFIRIGLLFSLAWIIRLTEPLFSVVGEEIPGRDLILLLGGFLLLTKSTHEIHQKLEGEEGASRRAS